jgi:hypothetical protein
VLIANEQLNWTFVPLIKSLYFRNLTLRQKSFTIEEIHKTRTVFHVFRFPDPEAHGPAQFNRFSEPEEGHEPTTIHPDRPIVLSAQSFWEMNPECITIVRSGLLINEKGHNLVYYYF